MINVFNLIFNTHFLPVTALYLSLFIQVTSVSINMAATLQDTVTITKRHGYLSVVMN